MNSLPFSPDSLQAILFDLDGVLMFSNDIHIKAYQQTFEEENLSGFLHTAIAGMRTDEVVAKMLASNGKNAATDEVNRVTARKRELAKAYFEQHVPVIDNCAQLLAALKQQYKLALCTSASRNTAEAFLNTNNHGDFFDFVICGPEVAQSKPHPEIYQRAMQALNVQPNQCLVVEDSLNGVQAGKEAGAFVVGVLGTTEASALEETGAFTVLEGAEKLIELLFNN